jgi:vancomycin resistance protein YoaR
MRSKSKGKKTHGSKIKHPLNQQPHTKREQLAPKAKKQKSGSKATQKHAAQLTKEKNLRLTHQTITWIPMSIIE